MSEKTDLFKFPNVGEARQAVPEVEPRRRFLVVVLLEDPEPDQGEPEAAEVEEVADVGETEARVVDVELEGLVEGDAEGESRAR